MLKTSLFSICVGMVRKCSKMLTFNTLIEVGCVIAVDATSGNLTTNNHTDRGLGTWETKHERGLMGYVRLVVKVMDSWLACYECEPRTAEDSPYKGGRCRLNLSKLKRPLVGVVWKLERELPAQMSSSSLYRGSKLRGPFLKAIE
ncbi:hypothetical protein TNCV_4240901 [Trichonephila clavipes]|nr:hypothetical protein TNCV_4240901 [Trichonephila clavipes]